MRRLIARRRLRNERCAAQCLGSRAGCATAGCVRPHSQGLLDSLWVQKGHGCMAVSALALVLQVDRCPAGRAGNLTHFRSNALEFTCSQVAHELFFPQEFKKRSEPPVTSVTHVIGKSAALAKIETERKSIVAARAIRLL